MGADRAGDGTDFRRPLAWPAMWIRRFHHPRAWGSLRRGHSLGWLILSRSFSQSSMVFCSKPTALGFIVFTTGLCLVAVKSAEREGYAPRRGRVDPRNPQSSPELCPAGAP